VVVEFVSVIVTLGEAFSTDTMTVVRTKARSVGSKTFQVNDFLFFKFPSTLIYYGAIYMFLSVFKICHKCGIVRLDSANSSILACGFEIGGCFLSVLKVWKSGFGMLKK